MKKIIAYHGTNAKFDHFDQGKARIFNDFYGGGVAYFTDDLSVAKTYAKANSRKSGVPYVYKVQLTTKKIFDVDHIFTGKELTQFYDDKTMEQFARGAKLLKLGGDSVFAVKVKLREGNYSLTGEQVFKGLSQGMVNTAKTRQKLIDLGYTGLRYNGGVNMGMATKHNVYLMYYAKDIKILDVNEVGALKEQLYIPPSHLNLSREQMPQISSMWLNSFLKEMRKEKIAYKYEVVKASVLKPSQSDKEYNIRKLLNKDTKSSDLPLLTSVEGYILDGHHRWVTKLNENPNSKISIIRINLPILELIRKAKEFKGVSYKSLHETIKSVIRESLTPKIPIEGV